MRRKALRSLTAGACGVPLVFGWIVCHVGGHSPGLEPRMRPQAHMVEAIEGTDPRLVCGDTAQVTVGQWTAEA